MKINVDQIPPQGFSLEETVAAKDLEIDTEIAQAYGAIAIKAQVSKITNAVSVDLDFNLPLIFTCSRCLSEFKFNLEKNLKLVYDVDKTQHEIDLDPEIRQDILLEYPVKPLCKPDCKGLCFKCGKNLNEGQCDCK